MKSRISELKDQLLRRIKRLQMLSELADEFAKLSPESGELVEIENEIAKLGSVEELNQAVISLKPFLKMRIFRP
jgi:DNA repair protein RecN (Recombination protein N)